MSGNEKTEGDRAGKRTVDKKISCQNLPFPLSWIPESFTNSPCGLRECSLLLRCSIMSLSRGSSNSSLVYLKDLLLRCFRRGEPLNTAGKLSCYRHPMSQGHEEGMYPAKKVNASIFSIPQPVNGTFSPVTGKNAPLNERQNRLTDLFYRKTVWKMNARSRANSVSTALRFIQQQLFIKGQNLSVPHYPLAVTHGRLHVFGMHRVHQ